MKKLIALLLAAVLTLGLAACGDKEGGSRTDKRDDLQTAGRIAVAVPEGYVLHAGPITGGSDENQCSIQPETPSMFDYYWIMVKTSEAEVAENVEMTGAVNGGEDVSVQVGDVTWVGCHYVYASTAGDVDCGAIYATVDGTLYQVNFAGHDPASSEMAAVLGSITAAE